jgi:formylglycine-generating enzyme required for sulfatase activity
VIRGGSWFYPAVSLRSAHRDFDSPGDRYYDIGLRLLSVH